MLFILGAGMLAASLGAFAQQPGKVWRIGWLSSSAREDSPTSTVSQLSLLMRGLGYIEGKNLVIERRNADGKYERLPGLAAELVQMKVDVIVTFGIQATTAAKKSTTTIPIVMVSVADPVESGLVHSLARPGGNVTGMTNLSKEITAKQLEILLGLSPKLSRVAILMNSTNSFHPRVVEHIRTAAGRTGVITQPVKVHTPQEIENGFLLMRQQNAGAVMVLADPFFTQQRHQIAALAAKHQLLSMYSHGGYVDVGGLVSYGQNSDEILQGTASYVDKLFKGAKPADLPVAQPTRFDLIVNMKTAKALGITLPPSIMVLVTKMVE